MQVPALAFNQACSACMCRYYTWVLTGSIPLPLGKRRMQRHAACMHACMLFCRSLIMTCCFYECRRCPRRGCAATAHEEGQCLGAGLRHMDAWQLQLCRSVQGMHDSQLQ